MQIALEGLWAESRKPEGIIPCWRIWPKGCVCYRLVGGNILALPLAGGGKASLHGQARCCWTTPCAATNNGRPQLFTSLQKLVWRCMDALKCYEPSGKQESSEDGHCCWAII